MAHRQEPSILKLPGLSSTASVAAECRDAWRSFVEHSEEWGKTDLVLWTYGVLAPLTRFAEDALSSRVLGPAAVEHDFARVDVRFVDRLVRTARARVLDTLWSLETAEARVDFGYATLASGGVVACADARGRTGFVPSATRGPLAERVLALVAADLLTAPEAFERDILCGDCGNVVLGPRPCCVSSELRYAAGEPEALRRQR